METISDPWKMKSNLVDDAVHSSQTNLLPASNVSKYSKTIEKRKLESPDNGKEDSGEAVADRRLTIHCIVEEITSLDVDKWKECPYNCRGTNKASRESSKWWHCECRNVEMNSCVIIEASTTMNDLVKTALMKLGYPSNTSSSAMGSILIRNWKALSLSAICPSPKMTVGDVLGELSMLVTLQIQILRPKSAFLQEIKDRLLSFLIAKSHNSLSNSGCPIDLLMLTKLCEETVYVKKHSKDETSEEVQQRFEEWLSQMQKNDLFDRQNNKSSEPSINISESKNNNSVNKHSSKSIENSLKINNSNHSGAKTGPTNIAISNTLNRESPAQFYFDKEYQKQNVDIENQLLKSNSPGFEVPERSLHCAQAKTRMRTSFDPDLELPKLLKWYMENPHPTRQQIHEYVQELNSLESRRGRKKLDMNNVVYWFKNARAAQKRSEYRKFCNIAMPGTKKSCNLLKIPLGKCGTTPEEQITLSDDDSPVVSENENTFRNRNGKCMQVLGNWNSNGAGEAVLEMQITPPKIFQSPSPVKVESDQLSDRDESSAEGMLSIAEDSVDNTEHNSADETQRRSAEPEEVEVQDFTRVISVQNDNNEVDIRKNNDMRAAEETKSNDKASDEICDSKIQEENSDKKNGFHHPETPLIPRYKSVSQNSILRHSFMYMSQCMNSKLNNIPLSSEERRKRNRTFIDPLTEVPRLEQWFQLSTHPSHSLIVRYTEELNGMPYRRKFPKLETKNVQFWFKNRRAKNKRLNYLDTNNFLR